tara:strand:- start:4503 stop:4766 length:264 start_codon:yes stop_codon:yes gene_type:complete
MTQSEQFKIGDIVTCIDDPMYNKPDWIDKPNQIIIEDIKEVGRDWVVAIVNGVYMQSDGSTSSSILLENLEIDITETRNNTIKKLLE